MSVNGSSQSRVHALDGNRSNSFVSGQREWQLALRSGSGSGHLGRRRWESPGRHCRAWVCPFPPEAGPQVHPTGSPAQPPRSETKSDPSLTGWLPRPGPGKANPPRRPQQGKAKLSAGAGMAPGGLSYLSGWASAPPNCSTSVCWTERT